MKKILLGCLSVLLCLILIQTVYGLSDQSNRFLERYYSEGKEQTHRILQSIGYAESKANMEGSIAGSLSKASLASSEDCKNIKIPFLETFELDSSSLPCWELLDVKNDGKQGWFNPENKWFIHNYPYRGRDAMRFYGASNINHDDWLISPSFEVDGGAYALTYYYRTGVNFSNEFEVLLSQNGTDKTEFTTVLLKKSAYNLGTYTKKVLYFTGITGEVHLAWHVETSGFADVYIDEVTLEKVDCISPDDTVVIHDIESNKAQVKWEDNYNSSWEVFTQEAGGSVPTGSGTLSSSKNLSITRTNGPNGTLLQPNTEYDFYVRSNCGLGKTSFWVGPITFRTHCVAVGLPFWEGFNKDSDYIFCWTVLDGNKDANLATNANQFAPYATGPYEGDRSMFFNGTSKITNHDDWLISPKFNLEATKYYRLTYYYKTNLNSKVDFHIKMSNAGIEVNNFTTTLKTINDHSSTVWEKDVVFVNGLSGETNIAWQVFKEKDAAYLYIDNVSLEEVKGCPEPLGLKSRDEDKNTATISWDATYGSSWEYLVQKEGSSTPLRNGIVITTNEVVITQDNAGVALEPNTNYLFYIRTLCGNDETSIWAGPFTFRTTCSVVEMPFWEGFNAGSETIGCWTIVDGNKDAASPIGNNIWRQYNMNAKEGSHVMYFYGNNRTSSFLPHNDWLISPTFSFDSKKMYRLRYSYRTLNTASNYEHAFEVLLSNSGLDSSKFTTVIVPNQVYSGTTKWEDAYILISGIQGTVNIAWHVTSKTPETYLYLDDVFLEEVQGCPEPMGLDVKEVKEQIATISWTNAFESTAWEYYVQESGQGIPTANGIVTKQLENIVSKDNKGANLEPNTNYEFYVRTVCGNGTYSIWSGPFKFNTACGILTAPFWEGFNTDSNTVRCWTILDNNGDATSPTGNNIWKVYDVASGVYEGNRSMYFYGTSATLNDDWLISPSVAMDGGMYVLKYHYKANAFYPLNFEVLLSEKGTAIDAFTKNVVSKSTYNNGSYVEEVVFIEGVKGNAHIAWHLTSDKLALAYLNLDHVSLKKVVSCPEPFQVVATTDATSEITVHWNQLGSSTNWEVRVVANGDDAAGTPLMQQQVSGSPNVVLKGLPAGRSYTIYIRTVCTGEDSFSDWSSGTSITLAVKENNECHGAVSIPVNAGGTCIETVGATFLGATLSSTVVPDCRSTMKNDIWFTFQAVNANHLLSVKDLKSPSGLLNPFISGALYEQGCGAITSSALYCFDFNQSNPDKMFWDLIPGQTYYVRLSTTVNAPDYIFNLCIISSDKSGLEVSLSGDVYSVEELIKEVFVNSECDLVSNINYQVGSGSRATQAINAFGAFSKGNSIFPFEKGIVLGTSEIQYVPGPHKGANVANVRGSNLHRWIGDRDINDAINDAGGGPLQEKRVTQVEFDFIPIKDSIKFEYLFASNSYIKGCSYDCQTGALFAAWLLDTETGSGQNLAKIKGTNTPIALNTIRDTERSGAGCNSLNSDLYWKHYANNQDNPVEAPIDFVGMTQAMESETVVVIPGRKYHIKLAVMDFCTNDAHTSAVFFNAGSFDLGTLDLGKDLLVETGEALCSEETRIISSGLALSEELNAEVVWKKDGIVIPGEQGSSLEVSESGTYTIEVNFPKLGCKTSGEVVVEIYPPISEVVHKPGVVTVCRNSLSDRKVNLSEVEEPMFIGVDKSIYSTSYYKTKDDAAFDVNRLVEVTAYGVGDLSQDTKYYLRVENTVTGCHEVFSFDMKIESGAFPAKRENVAVCASYVLPALEPHQQYYSEAGGQGVEYQAGAVMDVSGVHTLYVLQRNGDEGCYEEIAFTVSITEPVVADVFEDVRLDCSIHTLQPLSPFNAYFTEAGGKGRALMVGEAIPFEQRVYVYASSKDGLCVDESSYVVSYNECPIQKGLSPNGDGLNDAFDLSNHGITDLKIYNRYGVEVYSYGYGYTTEWKGQDKNGTILPDGTYYYVVISRGATRTGWIQLNK